MIFQFTDFPIFPHTNYNIATDACTVCMAFYCYSSYCYYIFIIIVNAFSTVSENYKGI